MEGQLKRKRIITKANRLLNAILLDQFERGIDIINDVTFDINQTFIRGGYLCPVQQTFFEIALRYYRFDFLEALLTRKDINITPEMIDETNISTFRNDDKQDNDIRLIRLIGNSCNSVIFKTEYPILFNAIRTANIKSLMIIIKELKCDMNVTDTNNNNVFQYIYYHKSRMFLTPEIKQRLTRIVLNNGAKILPIKDKNEEEKWKKYIAKWDCKTYNDYPDKFNKSVVTTLLLLRKVMPKMPRDIRYLIIEYVWNNYRKEFK